MFNDERFVQGDENVKVPAHLNFGKFMLDRLRRMGDEVALENGDTGEQLTYKEFTQYAVDLAVSLSKLGIGRYDVVALGSEKRSLFLPTALAIVFTGATFTPYELKSGRAVLRHKMNITQPKYFICSKLFWETYRDILQSFESIKVFITLDDAPLSAISVKSLISDHCNVQRFEPSPIEGQIDTAFVFYSSGTTGMPKGVQQSHLNCILCCLPDDFKDESLKIAFVCGEWYHGYDTFTTFKFLVLGRKIVYINEIIYENMLKCFEKYQVNIVITIPSLLIWLSKLDEKYKYNLDSLKTVYFGGSPLHIKTLQKVKQRFPSIENMIQAYGMTEVGVITSENWSRKGPKPGSVGSVSPGITLKVVDPETREVLGPHKHGEICLKGPAFMRGYIGIDPSTYLDEQGFFQTGDLGFYDDDGYFYIVDRLKEIICCGAHNVAPLELETILLLHPDVREAGVVGKPVPIYGEEPTAFVVRQPGSKVTEQELIDYVATEVTPYMQLRGGVRFIDQIPRNPRGKIMRLKLREMLEETA